MLVKLLDEWAFFVLLDHEANLRRIEAAAELAVFVHQAVPIVIGFGKPRQSTDTKRMFASEIAAGGC